MAKSSSATTIRLPSNVEAEKAVLASILIEPTRVDTAVTSLDSEDFSDVDPRHKIIFSAIKELNRKKAPISPQAIMNQIYSNNLADTVDMNYLLNLMEQAVIPENIDNYIQMVQEQSTLRQFLIAMKNIEETYANGVSDITSFIQESNDTITKISQERKVTGMEIASSVAERVNELLKVRRNRQGIDTLTGTNTGFPRLNQITHGWHPGELIIVAARPSVGKTAFAMNLAWNAASLDRKTVAFFSLEMSSEQIMTRLISMLSLVNADKLNTGNYGAKDEASIVSVLKEKIEGVPIYFDDTPNSRLGDIVSKATKMKAEHPDLSLIVVDYLGRISYGSKANPNGRQQEVSEITSALKTLARNLNVPIVCVCQLNRNVEMTESKVPSLANLRESGSIEQDADVVLLLYREDYYTSLGQSVKRRGRKKEEEEEKEEEKTQPKNSEISQVTILVAKNRNGQTGKIYLLFKRPNSLFENPSSEYEEQLEAAERARYGE